MSLTAIDSLHQLASAHGVATDFWDFHGQHREVSTETLVAVLQALGVDASSDDAVAAALAETEDAPWRLTLPHCMVVREGHEHDVTVHVPDGTGVSVHVLLEDGSRWDLGQKDHWVPPREVDGTLIGRATFVLPSNVPLGWHRIVATPEVGEEASCPLAVTPERLSPPHLHSERGWGAMAQLYSIRSRRSWGLGDARDLAELGSFFGSVGADFLLINPLHAAEIEPPITPSPYLPTSRRFVSPLYIRPEDIEEVAYLSGPKRALVQWAAEEVAAANASGEPLDRDASWRAKSGALAVIYEAGLSDARRRDFERFCAEMGKGLQDFALWCALTEKYSEGEWPEGLEHPDSARSALHRIELEERLDYFCYLQWIVDEQLTRAQRDARGAGMGLGLMQDLAVGVHPGGADAWALQDVFAPRMSVGAPPDMYNQQGQNWSQPPFRPDALARAGYAPLRDMIRTVLRHAGAIRVDHIMGLFRLWWIPEGAGPDEGTYVRFDHEAMMGVLLLEAQRAGATLIGEDLGTVEPWVRDYLAERGVFGTSVLWFEMDEGGYPKTPDAYRELSLATVNTHDMPPAAGYLAGEHVDVRERLGLLVEPADQVRAEALAERERMVARLTEFGLLEDGAPEREIIEAMHRYIALTPARLLGVSLTDMVGERRTQNQPGTDQEYPNWKVPLADGVGEAVMVEDLKTNGRLLSLVEVVNAALAGGPQGRHDD
ncbi:MAG: 4-alpha-glucanotransferase [Bowdeniella nasicola]|nr:4-alpha-glucanotransferase [Bowdeniella nasicola]